MKNLLCTLLCLNSILSLSAQTADSSLIFYTKGLNEQKAGHFAPALNYFQKAARFDTTNLDIQRSLGMTSIELRRYDLARIAFLKIFTRQNADTLAIRQLANLNFYSHKWDDAIKYGLLMRQMNLLDGTNYLIGRSYYEQENYGEAFKYLEAASLENPANAQIPYMIARAYVDMSNYKTATKYFQKAVAIDSSNPRWMYEMALTYAAIPDDKTAITYYELAANKGYKIDNDYLENFSNSCVLAGQQQRGIELMLKILDKKPGDLNILYNVAEAYYKTGKYQQAIDFWDKILYYDKQNAKALYMIGMAYQKKGESSKGQQLCDKAIEMDPSLANLKQKKMNMGL